jgi:hypothetical protein
LRILPTAGQEAVKCIRVLLSGALLADCRPALRPLETHPPTDYLPPEDVDVAALCAGGGTVCEWKGQARFFDASLKGRADEGVALRVRGAAIPRSRRSPGTSLSTPPRVDEAWVDAERAAAQPGGSYQGWITPGRGLPLPGQPERSGLVRGLLTSKSIA